MFVSGFVGRYKIKAPLRLSLFTFPWQEIERRRSMMRQRAQERKNEEMEVMELEDEGRSGEESESESEYEEYTDSEDEAEPRLKPVFIRKQVLSVLGAAGTERAGL